jgi:hypothetical protein
MKVFPLSKLISGFEPVMVKATELEKIGPQFIAGAAGFVDMATVLTIGSLLQIPFEPMI